MNKQAEENQEKILPLWMYTKKLINRTTHPQSVPDHRKDDVIKDLVCEINDKDLYFENEYKKMIDKNYRLEVIVYVLGLIVAFGVVIRVIQMIV